jgi:hypothetical protein
MDSHVLTVDLFKKLSLAVAIIRNTPSGIKPDAFTRSLAKRLFPRHQLVSILDEHLILRQHDLLTRFLSSPSTLISSSSLMDFTSVTIDNDDLNKRITNEYEYGEFAEKVSQLKDKKHQMKVTEIEFLINTLTIWITTADIDNRKLPIDACLYTIQLIANNLKTDNDKPYHIVLDLLSMIDKFLDCILDLLEHTIDDNVYYLHQMIISFGK